MNAWLIISFMRYFSSTILGRLLKGWMDMQIKPQLLTLYAVTDRGCLDGITLEEAVKEALKGGATLVQLREKDMPLQDFIEEAKAIKRVTDAYGVPLIINDNIEVCLACDAAGVHVGQSDMPAQEVRRLLGADKIIGVTAKTREQALCAQKQGADYLGSGAIFGSATKLDTKKMSMETLDAICDSVSIPVAAIGGICEENVWQLKGHHMSGAAVVSGLFKTADIAASARALKAAMAEICGYTYETK